jgi:hypothetical protein
LQIHSCSASACTLLLNFCQHDLESRTEAGRALLDKLLQRPGETICVVLPVEALDLLQRQRIFGDDLNRDLVEVGGVFRLQRSAAQVLTRYASATMSRTAPITTATRAGVQKEVLMSDMEEDMGEGVFIGLPLRQCSPGMLC